MARTIANQLYVIEILRANGRSREPMQLWVQPRIAGTMTPFRAFATTNRKYAIRTMRQVQEYVASRVRVRAFQCLPDVVYEDKGNGKRT